MITGRYAVPVEREVEIPVQQTVEVHVERKGEIPVEPKVQYADVPAGKDSHETTK